MECSDYRTISLIPHASKIILRMITKKFRDSIRKTQFCFRKNMGTREAILVMRMLGERSIEYCNDMYNVCLFH